MYNIYIYKEESNENLTSYYIFIWLYLRFSLDSPSYIYTVFMSF